MNSKTKNILRIILTVINEILRNLFTSKEKREENPTPSPSKEDEKESESLNSKHLNNENTTR